MTRRRNAAWGLFGLLVGTLALTVALGGSLEEVELRPGQQVDSGPATGDPEFGVPGGTIRLVWPWLPTLRVLLLSLALLFVGLVILMLRTPDLRRQMLPQLLVVGGLLIAVGIASLIIDYPLAPLATEEEEEEASPHWAVDAQSDALRGDRAIVEEPDLFGETHWPLRIAVGLAVVLVLALSAQLIVVVRRRRTRAAAPTGAEVIRIAHEAARELRSGMDPVGVVQSCYARMVRSLADAYGARPLYRTPREFAVDLHRMGVENRAVDTLTELFELVRYGARPDAEFADRARRCLASLALKPEASS